MTIALKIGNEDSSVKGFIYLDAVTSYTKSYKGKVTSFPIDSGAQIADHYIGANDQFTLEGVVSNVDIGGLSDLVSIDGEKPLNARQRPETPVIAGQSAGLKFLPSVVKQFMERGDAQVMAEPESQTSIPSVEALFEELMRGLYYNSVDKKWRNKMTLTTLYEMDGMNFVNAKTDLVITDIAIKEDPDSGDAMMVSISLEKVRFVTLDKTDMPKKAVPAAKKKTAATQNKGKQTAPAGVCKTNDTKIDVLSGDKSKAPTHLIPGKGKENLAIAHINRQPNAGGASR